MNAESDFIYSFTPKPISREVAPLIGSEETPWDETLGIGGIKTSGTDSSSWTISQTWEASALKGLALAPQKSIMDSLLKSLQCIPNIHCHLPKIETILNELFINALEHGVLELSSSLKSSAEGFLEFYRLRHERLENLQSAKIMVSLQYKPNGNFSDAGGAIKIRVTDSGNGFDYHNFVSKISALSFAEASILPYGRGLRLIMSLCDEVQFIGNGNTVDVLINWKTKH